MACECIEMSNRSLEGENRILDMSHWFGPSGQTRTTVALNAVVLKPKRGERPYRIIPVFCPFCGVRYQPEENVAVNAGSTP